MDKKSEFKKFLSGHPEILKYIKEKEMTFQDFYEIYDIYGEDANVWDISFQRLLLVGQRPKHMPTLAFRGWI